MKKLISLTLALSMVLCLTIASKAEISALLMGVLNANTNPGQPSTPPAYHGDVDIQVGQTVELLVHTDNFQWFFMGSEPEGGEAFRYFTTENLETAKKPYGLKVSVQNAEKFDSIGLMAKNGYLYIVATAQSAGSAPLIVAITDSLGNISVYSNVTFKVSSGGSGSSSDGQGGSSSGGDEGSGGGSSNEESDKGSSSSEDENSGGPSGPDEGSGGSGGGSQGGGNPGGGSESSGSESEPDPKDETPQSTDGLHITGYNTLMGLQRMVQTAWGSSPVVEPDGQLWLALRAEAFVWEGPDGKVTPQAKADVTLQQLTQAGFGVEAKGDGVTANLSSQDGCAGILLSLGRRKLSLNDTDFAATLYLNMNGSQIDEATVSGKHRVSTISVIEDGQEVDIQDGTVAVAQKNVRDVVLYLGKGVFITADLQDSGRYAGIAERSQVTAEESKISGAVLQYELTTLGIVQGTVYLTELGDSYYVYSETGEYLGTTDSHLPLYSLYYLSQQGPDSGGSGPLGGGTVSGGSGNVINGTVDPRQKNEASSFQPVFYRGEEVDMERVWEVSYRENDNHNPDTGK